ncbi:hypothetical protein AURDEDRAFT_92875 [Auricularia subglabra TFB-10046 SS5]|uniref:Pre-rRNA-processing protein TSR2 n=1 Tax=Auricularia subglabra (strain TFB-10046 / SS5) TaxID=717982 RepID=J0LFA0_AURST|nr:hypothetical protein AURDEDRAFT_92875 [Auricularia subglabra TFB-10046 SS5]
MSDAPPPAATVLFARGVIAILNAWPVLRLAVEQAWGGAESAAKRRWLAGEIVDAFESASAAHSPDAPYVEEMLLQVLQDEFEVVVDDDSSADVAKQIVQLWAGGDVQQSAVDALEAAEQRARGKRVVAQQGVGNSDDEWDDTDDESGDEDGDDQDEAPQLVDRSTERQREEPEVDDEGFTVVKRGNRSAR